MSVILAARAYDRAKERNGLSRVSPCTCNSRDNERSRDIAKKLLLLSPSLPRLTRIKKDGRARFEGRAREIAHAPGIIPYTINFCAPRLSITLCPSVLYSVRGPASLLSRFSSLTPLFFAKPPFRIPARTEIARSTLLLDSREKFIVGKLQCFDNFLPRRSSTRGTHDCDRKEHALTQILRRLKQRFGLFATTAC